MMKTSIKEREKLKNLERESVKVILRKCWTEKTLCSGKSEEELDKLINFSDLT